MSAAGFYFDPDGTGMAVFLGSTEARIMEIAWREQEVTVKQVLASWERQPVPAYTTVMTILRRLAEKGLLERRKRHRYHVYAPAVARETFVRQRLARIRECLSRNFGDQD